jgi:glycosyltransferase involved in cell wall biosynthesis
MHRVAIILPAPYRGGTLRWLRHTALMLRNGARSRGVELEVVACPLRDHYDLRTDFAKLMDEGISVRPFRWRFVMKNEAGEILDLAGRSADVRLMHSEYAIPDDGHNNLLDCDHWLFISDRVPKPIVPIRPYSALIADALQRYAPAGFSTNFLKFEQDVILPFLRDAEFVMSTTPATCYDLQSYIGLPTERIVKLPVFIEKEFHSDRCESIPTKPYFVWLTNTSPHKNHALVLDALQTYYAMSTARPKAFMIGPLTEAFRRENDDPKWQAWPEVISVRKRIAETPILSRNIIIGGELSDREYDDALRRCRFLLNANQYDNGCLSTIDAVYLRRPVICARYPAQQYFDRLFGLNGLFFDPHDARELVVRLVEIEERADTMLLPSIESLNSHAWQSRAEEVFDAVADRLITGDALAYR